MILIHILHHNMQNALSPETKTVTLQISPLMLQSKHLGC